MAALASVGAVKGLVYDTVFKRAQEIAASDKLHSVVFEGEDLCKGTAECLGSSPADVYQLSISIEGVTARGDCSCPAGKSAKAGLCKHAVALLLRRTQEVQGTKASPSSSSPEDLVVPTASQIDDAVPRRDATKPAEGGAPIQPSMAKRPDPPTSSSKRALPSWMLGGAAAAAPSSSKPKPNKRAAADPKPPRPPPPPAKRARRAGQPLKIANGSDEEEEGPGEVDDAPPTKKGPSPMVTEEVEFPESVDPPTEGAAARERSRLRASKKEGVVADAEGDVEVKRSRGRSRKAVSKEVIDPPVRVGKRRRLERKYVEDDSGVLEDEAAAVDAENGDGFELTAEDMLFFAREQLEKQKAAEQAEDVVLESPEKQIEAEIPHEAGIPHEKGIPHENSSQEKKPSTMFSMSRWKEMTSESRGGGGSPSLGPDDLDKILTDHPSAANSQKAAEDVSSSLQAAEPVASSNYVPSSRLTATKSSNVNAVADDMFDIFFGPTLSQLSAKKVGPTASFTPIASQEDKPGYKIGELGLEAPTASFSVLPTSVDVGPAVRASRVDLSDPGEAPKPKKKSSLKDRVKMLLN